MEEVRSEMVQKPLRCTNYGQDTMIQRSNLQMKLLAMDWLMIIIDLGVEIEIVLQFWNEFDHVYEWGKLKD